MFRPIISLTMPGAAQAKLQESGFFYYEDLFDTVGGSVQAADVVLKQWNLDVDKVKKSTVPPITYSALDFLQEECSSHHIVSFCKELDDMLGGGVPVHLITELCGAPGSGKTQICLQLCIDVQIPKAFGGLGGEAIFITTDGSFTFDRLNDMAEGCLLHCRTIADRFNEDGMQEEVDSLSSDSFLQGVHYVSTHNHDQLIAAVHITKEFLMKINKVKLIVIDSLAFSFRDGEMSTLERTGLLYQLLEELQSLATKHKLAVVITNHLTTEVRPGKESQLIPAMGDSFGHRVNLRLMLGPVSNGHFAAMLLKSPSRPLGIANFKICLEGIRDCG